MKQSVLIAKGSDEHERYFETFLNHRALRLELENRLSTKRDVEVQVTRAVHAGTKTRFTLLITTTL